MDFRTFTTSISKFSGTTVVFLLCLSFLIPEHVAGKSVPSSLPNLEGFVDGDTSTEDVETTTLPQDEESTTMPSDSTSSIEPPVNETIRLDSNFHPDVEWDMERDAVPLKFTRWANSSKFSIAVHMMKCNFGEDDFIEIHTGQMTINWTCKAKGDISYVDFNEKHFDLLGFHRGRHFGDKYITIPDVIDGLKEVWITPKFNSANHHHPHNNSKKIKAALVISIYRDFEEEDACGKEFFDCHQELCPKRCCSDHRTSTGNEGTKQKSEAIFNFWGANRRNYRHHGSRCIPKSLVCNSRPNCGVLDDNIDEANEVCHEEVFCKCESVCLTWNYILTSLAIAVLFIITPTAIVFALFHRRNVALERARLMRMAQSRMADLRGEFTRNAPANDHPPTYDEVCDIKVPPPCFCQAIAMEMGMDAIQFQEIMQERTCGESCTNGPVDQNQTNEIESTEGASGNRARVGVQNLGFTCSCQNIVEEVPPSYASLPINQNVASNEENYSDGRRTMTNSNNEEASAEDKSTNL